MLQAKICYMFPYQSDGFRVKIYQTTRLPWFLRSLEVQMLISGNLFGRCFSELKKSPQIHGVHVSDHGKNPSMSPQNESCRVKIHPKGIENPSYTLNLISSEKQRSTKALNSHNQHKWKPQSKNLLVTQFWQRFYDNPHKINGLGARNVAWSTAWRLPGTWFPCNKTVAFFRERQVENKRER